MNSKQNETKLKMQSLKAFCRSERQTELLEAIISTGSVTKAAKAIGCNHSTVSASVKRIEKNAALQGWSPDHDLTKVIPDSHYLKGASTCYDGDGNITQQWIKTDAKKMDLLRDLQDFAEALGENEKGKFKKVKKPSGKLDSELLTVYALADLHLGMLAWSRETREDYDLAIAREALRVGADLLIEKTPKSEMAIIANLGDFFHFDNDTYQTTSGNILDTDGRWTKVVEIGVDCLLYFTRRALEKHKTVKIINSVGNHDGQSAAMLPFILKPYFENEHRVIVEDAPRAHHYHLFGANLLGMHHGHRTRANRLPMTMVNDMLTNSEIDTSEVEFMHWLTGHIHHETKEYDGCLVESFRALCAKDSYHAGGGYRAGRELQAVTYHRKFGEAGRDRVSYKMIQHFSKNQSMRRSTTRNP